MLLRSELIELNLKETFRISKGEALSRKNCIVHLEEALGECCPSIYYGYSAKDCQHELQQAKIEINETFELNDILPTLNNKYSEMKSLLAGLDIALHDYISSKLKLPLYQYLELPAPVGLETSYTISIVNPDELEDKLKQAEGFKSIKLKIGSNYDQGNLEFIKQQGKYKVRVDANGAFNLEQISRLIPLLNSMPIELVEEPLKDSRPEDLRELRKLLNAPIFLDESIINMEDIDKYSDCVDGINIKIQRMGGIRPALMAIQAAKSAGMKIMLGCMLETSIGNTATAHLAGLADFLDLDSSILLADDPFDGLKINQGRITMPEGRYGLGVFRREDA